MSVQPYNRIDKMNVVKALILKLNLILMLPSRLVISIYAVFAICILLISLVDLPSSVIKLPR